MLAISLIGEVRAWSGGLKWSFSIEPVVRARKKVEGSLITCAGVWSFDTAPRHIPFTSHNLRPHS